jgi:hypothetical protein
MTMDSPEYRTMCSICGAVTIVLNLGDVTIWIDKDGFGTPSMIRVCPEHRAKYLRMVSDFLVSS